jgi:spore germination protein GerM
MKKIIFVLILVVLAVGAWYFASSKPSQNQTQDVGTTVKLYYYNPAKDQGPGGAQCSRNGLVAVERIIPKTETPLQDSIKLLLRGELTDEEKALGITTEFPLAGVTLANAVINNGVATLTFSDPQNKTSGGSCRAGILWFEIEATAKQFPSVSSVRFLPATLFQP